MITRLRRRRFAVLAGSRLLWAAVIALVLSSLPAIANTNFVINGDFETPAYPPGTPFVAYFAVSPAIVGWLVEAGAVDHIRDYWEPANGEQSIDLTGSPGRGTLRQDMNTTAGAKYRLRFAMAGNPEPHPVCAPEPKVKKMEVRWGTTVVGTLSHNTTGRDFTNMGWTTHEFIVTANSSVTPLRFKDVTDNEPFAFCGATLDDVFVTALTPEERIQLLIEAVEALGLNQGLTTSLIVKLNAASASLERGQPHVACNQLGAFINELNALMQAGQLPASEGQPFVDEANAISIQLGC